jgi:hypothetical protein
VTNAGSSISLETHYVNDAFTESPHLYETFSIFSFARFDCRLPATTIRIVIELYLSKIHEVMPPVPLDYPPCVMSDIQTLKALLVVVEIDVDGIRSVRAPFQYWCCSREKGNT